MVFVMRIRLIVLIFLVLFIVGCSNQIKIEDYELVEEYNETTGEIVHNLYFTLYNPSFKVTNCNATLNLDNEGKVIGKNYRLGEIDPRSKEGRVIRFIMPDGETSFNLSPVCGFAR